MAAWLVVWGPKWMPVLAVILHSTEAGSLAVGSYDGE